MLYVSLRFACRIQNDSCVDKDTTLPLLHLAETMPIFYGKPLVGLAKAPAEFASRDIKLLKTDVTSAGYTGIPYIYSAIYAAYVYFISYFMSATVQKKKVYTSRFFAGNYLAIKMDALMKWRYPDLVVGATRGHDAEFEALARDVNGVIVSGKNTKTMSVTNIDRETYLKINGANVMKDCHCDQGRSNLDDFQAFLMCLRVFTAFLLTHQYPNERDQVAEGVNKRIKLEEVRTMLNPSL